MLNDTPSTAHAGSPFPSFWNVNAGDSSDCTSEVFGDHEDTLAHVVGFGSTYGNAIPRHSVGVGEQLNGADNTLFGHFGPHMAPIGPAPGSWQCPNCGAANSANTPNFCPICGYKM
jgi:hypothetical protein